MATNQSTLTARRIALEKSANPQVAGLIQAAEVAAADLRNRLNALAATGDTAADTAIAAIKAAL
ncbi:hypothetical protein [Burkholderia multivorans]|uniref:hypothetical protein n=1 Tax=Burkholderia multivorans TaxID=87883 RepID=UPI00075F2C46|nr:hypothetical protein [Burkholderia multivorans]KVQ85560.1 hypothetical protein WK07_04520 [Burkholderia multivorans]PRF55332.1 hypothetical protein C6Q11_05275 [Burkholderia multivorans]